MVIIKVEEKSKNNLFLLSYWSFWKANIPQITLQTWYTLPHFIIPVRKHAWAAGNQTDMIGLYFVSSQGAAGNMCSVWALTQTAFQVESLMNVGVVNDLPYILCDRDTAGRLTGVPQLFWGLAKHR